MALKLDSSDVTRALDKMDIPKQRRGASKEKTQIISVRLDAETKKELTKAFGRRGLDVGTGVRALIFEFLEKGGEMNFLGSRNG